MMDEFSVRRSWPSRLPNSCAPAASAGSAVAACIHGRWEQPGATARSGDVGRNLRPLCAAMRHATLRRCPGIRWHGQKRLRGWLRGRNGDCPIAGVLIGAVGDTAILRSQRSGAFRFGDRCRLVRRRGRRRCAAGAWATTERELRSRVGALESLNELMNSRNSAAKVINPESTYCPMRLTVGVTVLTSRRCPDRLKGRPAVSAEANQRRTVAITLATLRCATTAGIGSTSESRAETPRPAMLVNHKTGITSPLASQTPTNHHNISRFP